MKSQKFSGLAELLKHDADALHYFEKLPMDVRDRIAPHGQRIDSFETLRSFVEDIEGHRG